jgi:hypothetical protein
MRYLTYILMVSLFWGYGCSWQRLQQPKILSPAEILAECEDFWNIPRMGAGLSAKQKEFRINHCVEKNVTASKVLPETIRQTPAGMMQSCLDYYGTQYYMVNACAKTSVDEAHDGTLTVEEFRPKCQRQLESRYSGRELTYKVNECTRKKIETRRLGLLNAPYIYY